MSIQCSVKAEIPFVECEVMRRGDRECLVWELTTDLVAGRTLQHVCVMWQYCAIKVGEM